MITNINQHFILETKRTTYCFRVLETGHLEHLYYGSKLNLTDGYGLDALWEKQVFPMGNLNSYSAEFNKVSLENLRLEMSSYGKGDIREPFIEVVHGDGSYTSDFLFEKAEIRKGKPEFVSLPGSYDDKDAVEWLCVTLADKQYDLKLELNYFIYSECDVITRNSRFINESKETVKLQRLLSTQLDFMESGYVFTTFNGGWAREMKKNKNVIKAGKHVNASYTGTSSSRANPFVMLARPETTEDYGECYGLNLIYSGNHMEVAEVNSFGKTRFVAGINPQSFCFTVEPGESFEAPEAVMTYSNQGYNGMSGHMHRFVREHIVRGVWKEKARPVLLNSWEASYFDINERKLLNLAKAGAEVGIELFVMDDGWFGERDNDTCSLGDWDANMKKLPGGVAGLSEKVKKLGLQFGIWVEPEMINVKSRLYEAHPDWVLQIPEKPHSEGRNQRILDLTKQEVQDYIIEKMSEVFRSADISYVKWDMNRTFTDYYSDSLPADRQGEVAHRYVMGLYRCMKELTERFPQILFEGCSAGGNRFDLGILCYFPQIWASDDTDALCRAEMQNNYSYGYPLSTVSAHVSACPNHQTLRTTPLETRFAVAAFGVFGYECNLCDMKREELAEIKAQIDLYKEWREVLQKGRFYRGRNFEIHSQGGSCLENEDGNLMEWTCVAPDGKRAVGFLMQKLAVPNTAAHFYRAKGLKADGKYHFFNRRMQYNVKNFGDLVNTVSPIHIKQDSLVHNLVAHFVKMEGETEDLNAYGDMLMSGVHLKQAFAGTGYNNDVRYFPDFGARLYFMEETE